MSSATCIPEKLFSAILSLKIILVALPFLLLFSLLTAFFALNSHGMRRICIDICINLPIVFPPIGMGFMLVYLFGGEGPIGSRLGMDLMFSFPGLVLAAFITGMPFIAQTTVSGIDGSVTRLCEASYTMGKGKLETFLKVALPLLRTNIIAGTLLASARILGEVGITLMIGGNIKGKTNTISLEIYNAVLDGENSEAFELSLFLIVFSTVVFSIIKLMEHRKPA